MTSISSSTLSTLTTDTTNATDKAAGTYNEFLNLLTTQLQNQDPLNPMDSSTFTNQLVSFSEVEQGILTNQKLDTMLQQNNSNQISQSLTYIGKDVYYKGDTAYLDQTNPDTKVGYAIDGDYASATLHITDADGNLVRSIPVANATPAGSVDWDGKDDQGNLLKSGNYTVAIDALDSTGTKVDTYTAIPGHVQGIETVDGVLYLALKGDSRVDATNVLSVSNPDTEATDPVADAGTDNSTTDTGTSS